MDFPIATRIPCFENSFWINLPDSVVNSGAPAHRTVTTIEVDEGVVSSDFLGAKQRERERRGRRRTAS
jgi:hypothetical protein